MQGFIQSISSRQTSVGTMYDVTIDGTRYGAGKYQPTGVAEGDYVEFQFESKGQYKNLVRNSLKKTAAPAGVSASAAPTKSANGYDSRQETISRQAAANTANAFVANLIAAGSFGAKKPSVDALEAITAEYTMRFYKQATGEDLELDINIAPGAEDADE